MRYVSALFIISCILMFFLICGGAEASLVSNHKVDVYLQPDGAAVVDATVRYEELTTKDLPYFFMGEVIYVEAYHGKKRLNCSTHPRPYGVYVSCIRENNSIPLYNYTARFRILAGKLASRVSNDVYRFTYNYAIREPTKHFTLVLYLPEGYALLKSNRSTRAYYPENGVIGSDGRHVTITWDIPSPRMGETLTFSALYEYVGAQRATSYMEYMLYVGILVLLGVIALFLRRKSEAVMDVLTEDERIIVNFLKERGKPVKQRDIVKATNFSKAKVSRLLAELEERGIVKRERVGRINRVTLVKRV